MLRYNLPERRRAYRVYTRIPIVCEINNPENNTIQRKIVMSKDINSEGIYFKIDELLPLNTEINITFQLPKSNRTISAAIRVVRVEAIENERSFGIGATFTKLADKDKEEIKQLMERLNISKLLEFAIKKEASDLHLVTDMPPVLRVHGQLEILDAPKLDAEDLSKLIYTLMDSQQIIKFEREKELDFAIQYDTNNRFRVNVHQQRGLLEAAFRLISSKIFSFEELNIPEVVKDLARQKEGLIMVIGPTGSGKTTTIAAMVELINQERKAVIIILERPIEYVHTNAKSIIKQREVGIDTSSFSVALKSSLRQDPNVIVVGELDDIETVRISLIAAEAGYLVIVSFHAPDTVQAIDRLANMFPLENRKQILSQLANCLKGIVCQLLIPCKDRRKRVLATEIIIANEAVKRVIRNDELIQLPTIIQTGVAYQMQPMSDIIRKYWEQGMIDAETATFYSEELRRHGR